MSLGAAIYAQAQASAGLTALLGTGSAIRFYKLNPPQGVAAPYIIWQGVTSIPGTVHIGATGATERIIQFACFAATSAGAQALRDALIAAFDGITLSNGDNGTLEDDSRDDYDEAVQLYRADADFHF